MSNRKHGHYFKKLPTNEIDVYGVLKAFEVESHAIGHAIKKLLVAGARGGGKNRERDFQEAIDSIERELEMMEEERKAKTMSAIHPRWTDKGE